MRFIKRTTIYNPLECLPLGPFIKMMAFVMPSQERMDTLDGRYTAWGMLFSTIFAFLILDYVGTALVSEPLGIAILVVYVLGFIASFQSDEIEIGQSTWILYFQRLIATPLAIFIAMGIAITFDETFWGFGAIIAYTGITRPIQGTVFSLINYLLGRYRLKKRNKKVR